MKEWYINIYCSFLAHISHPIIEDKSMKGVIMFGEKIGFWGIVGHFVLTLLTGGLWLIVLLIRYLVKKS
jgi:hypothetical protein